MPDLQSQFEQAVLAATRLPSRPCNDTLLELYALFKQGSEGNVHGDQPGFFDFVGTAKFEAWGKLKGMSRDEAMTRYVALVASLDT
ncbi:acyl-CoA-binding protein [Luteibacter sp. Sphag1AF]|uniref:acyl-CoA-binding protein n=1 Tax=Luteibacter sp. Sphag1AF TaxID=2587031 RepID=UPI00160B75D1|nr:acyl-CoA-binding protein [Luteibacter sp. Sphag1AF]MBB3226927.1 acyl-CoA-binding protein [Luteibacter sp. Sphag1AF]